MRGRARLGSLVASLVTVTACNALLGNEPGYLVSPDAGEDGEAPGDASLERESGSDGAPVLERGDAGDAGDTGLDAGDAGDAGLAVDSGDATSADAEAGVDSGDASPDAGDAACPADASSDPLNCGACGHSCLGGACASGMCQPVTIAEEQGFVGQLATDGTFVFWTRSATLTGSGIDLRRAPVSENVDSGVTSWKTLPILDASSPEIVGVALAGSALLWTQTGILGESDENGLGHSLSLPAAGAQLATNDSRVFYANHDTVSSALLDGGDEIDYMDGGSPPSALAASAATFFWAEGITGDVWGSALPDGTPQLVFGGTTLDDLSLAVGPGALFIVQPNSGEILEAPLDGGVPAGSASPIVTGLTEPHAPLFDGTNLYWLETAGGVSSVHWCNPKSCTNNPPLFTGLDETVFMTQDGVSLYWGTTTGAHTNGWVQRLAK